MSDTGNKQIILVETRNPLCEADNESLINRMNREINSKEGFKCNIVYLPHVVHDDQSYTDMVISNSLIDLRSFEGVSVYCVVCLGFNSCMVKCNNKKIVQLENFDNYIDNYGKMFKYEKTAAQVSKIIMNTISRTAVQLIKYKVDAAEDKLRFVEQESGINVRNATDFDGLVDIICGVL